MDDVELAIIELLLASRPTDQVVAEESGRVGEPGSGRCWLVDPLCGTLDFAARTGPVAVNVALRDGDTVTAAAVTDPLAGVTYWTDGIVAAADSATHEALRAMTTRQLHQRT